jgi:hypothetical protein
MKKTLLFTLIFTISFGSIFSQQIPNGSFEYWTDTLGFDIPISWDNPNATLSLFSLFPVTKSDDAAHGNYSAKLESKLLTVAQGDFVIPGVITLGEFKVDFLNFSATLVGGIQFPDSIDRPEVLTGSYKNYPAANDFTMVTAIFTKYREVNGKRDTIGGGAMFFPDEVDTWTNFSIPIEFYTEDQPDTFNIIVVSSNILFPNKDSYMFIDNLAFQPWAGIDDIEIVVETSVFPNPANDKLSFVFGKKINASLNIYNNDGQQIYSGVVNGTDQTIDVSSFAAGTFYFGVFEKNKKISSGQFVISR